jgi:hypothetical protein
VAPEELVLLEHQALRADARVRGREPVVPDERHALDERRFERTMRSSHQRWSWPHASSGAIGWWSSSTGFGPISAVAARMRQRVDGAVQALLRERSRLTGRGPETGTPEQPFGLGRARNGLGGTGNLARQRDNGGTAALFGVGARIPKPLTGGIVREERPDVLVERLLVAAGERRRHERGHRRRARDVHRERDLAEVVAGPEHPPRREPALVADRARPAQDHVEVVALLALEHDRVAGATSARRMLCASLVSSSPGAPGRARRARAR